MKEIEILVKIEEDKESALKKLSKFKSEGIKEIKDYYFAVPNNSNPITKWLRIRKENNKTKIAFKKDHLTKDNKWLYSDEYETEVEDFEIIKKIILNSGHTPLVNIINKKHIFRTDKYEIVLEDVEDLGIFLEIEKLNPKEDENIEEVRKKIFELMIETGINVSEEMHLGKPELLLKKKKQKNF